MSSTISHNNLDPPFKELRATVNIFFEFVELTHLFFITKKKKKKKTGTSILAIVDNPLIQA